MGNVLRPAKGADDERLYPAGYIESVSSTHLVTLTDDFVPLYDSLSSGIAAINAITLTDDFPILYDQDTGILIRGVGLTDSLPIITDGISASTYSIYVVQLEDGLYIFSDDIKSKATHIIKLDDQLINLTDSIEGIITRGVVCVDNLAMYDNMVKQLKLTFAEDMPLWISDVQTQRFHWACVFAVSKISNHIGVSTTIEDDYLVDRIEETPGGDVTESIDTTFNIGEINQIEDE